MSDLEILKTTIQKQWSTKPSDKAKRYVGQFFETVRIGSKITAKVTGNHGDYTVSIQVDDNRVSSACSCYIGKYGGCHHCEALGLTFLNAPGQFTEIEQRPVDKIKDLAELQAYLRSVTLDDLIKALKANGITQKAFADSIGMSSRHLSAIKSSERRNRYFHELGATKLACMWVLERLGK